MKILNKILLIAASLCSTISFAQDFPGDKGAEVLKGVTTDEEGVTFQVYSGGCTEKEDFSIRAARRHPPLLLLQRENVDGCRAYVRYGVKITYTWEELAIGNEDFVLMNEIDPTIIRR